MALTSKFESLAERIGSRLNPILVKELRQAMRSRFILGVFFAMVVVFTFIALFASWFSASGVTTSSGPAFFTWIYGVIAFAVLMFVPGYAGSRIGIERAGQDPDLLFITTLKPSAIVRGKALVAALLALFLVSTALPFMAFAYTLRGIDLPNIALIMLITFAVSCGASYITILVGSIPTGKIGKVVLFLVALYGLVMLSIGAIVAVVAALDVGGVVSSFSRATGIGIVSDWFMVILFLMLVIGSVMWLCHSLSTALISPPPSNRVMPIRICLTVVFAVAVGISFCLQLLYPSGSSALMGAVVGIPLFIFGMLLAVCERERPGPRVAATLPRSQLGRMAVFPFYTGSANGVLWCALIGLGVLGLCVFFPRAFASDDLQMTGTFLLYVYAYAITALLLRKTILKKVVQPGQTWGLAILLVAVISLLTFFITDIIGQSAGLDIEMPYGNLIHFASGNSELQHFLFSLIWALLVTLLWFPIAYRQLAAFNPTNEEPFEA